MIEADDYQTLLDACGRLRDRFLLQLLRETGMRIGEALGLRHEDLSIARREVAVNPRLNDNGARVKRWKPRTVPVPAALFSGYARYLDEEYGDLDSDFVFVNLWAAPLGHAMTYATARDVLLRLRQRTGLDGFTFHHLRHTYATELIRKGTDWAIVARGGRRPRLGRAATSDYLGSMDAYGCRPEAGPSPSFVRLRPGTPQPGARRHDRAPTADLQSSG